MATSAFKSTTRRTPVAGPPSTAADSSSSSSKSHRRSRSLSRFSRRPPPENNHGNSDVRNQENDHDLAAGRRGRFVNTTRGSVFPEISLDDLAVEFFPKDLAEAEEEKRMSRRRNSEIGTAASQRRGRSVSRQGSGVQAAVPEANSRRRRSVSVARHHISDSEGDADYFQSTRSHSKTRGFSNGNSQSASFQKPTVSSHRKLGRSASQKDLLRSQDVYSVSRSQSSALTDDETGDDSYGKRENERTIRAVYAQKSEHPTEEDVNHGLQEAMRKELRAFVDEIRVELEQAMDRKPSALASHNQPQSNSSDVFQAVSAIRRNYATKLERSEKRKQDLLAEMALEEQRGKELSKIVKELLPNSRNCADAPKARQTRKKSNDRNKVSKRLDEEAEKYFEDFISNVEDTDFSSFDEERSETSSTFSGISKTKDGLLHVGETKTYSSPAECNPLPVEMDGVNLPWLKWETSNDGSPISSKKVAKFPVTPKSLVWDAAQDGTFAQVLSIHTASSRASWSPEFGDGSVNSGPWSVSKSGEDATYQDSRFDMDEYLERQHSEELLFESWRERHRISSGGLLLCSNAHSFPLF